MTLNIQIITSIFSFLFGIFFYIFLKVNSKIIYNTNEIIKIFGTTLVVLISIMVYFLILKKLNDALFHPYHLLLIITSFSLTYYLHQNIVKHLKK